MTTSPWVRAPYQWPTAEVQPSTFEVISGADALASFHVEFREWAQDRRLPTTATSSWLFATSQTYDGTHPWAVVARDSKGTLQGAVMLLDEEVEGLPVITLAGTDQGNRGTLTVDTPEVAEEIARELAQVLLERTHPRQLLLGPLDADDPSVHAFASALPGARLVADDPIPVIRQDSSDAKDYLSQGMRRTLRKSKNRLFRDDREMSVHFTTDTDEIIEVIPQLERCHRDRDHVHGRASDLDDDRGRQLWHERLRRLSETGHLELATLSIDGQFAAHALGAIDHPVYRVLEGRFVTEWARYAPGRLLEAAVLQRVLDDELFDSLDWMTAVAPEKLLATNAADRMVLVHRAPSV